MRPPTKCEPSPSAKNTKEEHTVEVNETPMVDTMIANVPSTMTNAKQHSAVESVTRARVSVLLNGTRWVFGSIKYAPSFSP